MPVFRIAMISESVKGNIISKLGAGSPILPSLVRATGVRLSLVIGSVRLIV